MAERRVFPAIDIARSGTRREELLLEPEVLAKVFLVRRMSSMISSNSPNPTEATERLLDYMGKYHDNEYGHHWALPDEEAFGKAVAYLLDHPHRRLELGRQGPAHVAKNFRWDVAAEKFVQIASETVHNAPGRAKAQPDVSERELVAA